MKRIKYGAALILLYGYYNQINRNHNGQKYALKE